LDLIVTDVWRPAAVRSADTVTTDASDRATFVLPPGRHLVLAVMAACP
jgi:hypothetical protein